MQKVSILLIILTLILCFGTISCLAQEKHKEFVVIKLIIKKEKFEHLIKVPVEKSFNDSKLIGGGWATVDCIDCLLTSRYELYGFAENVNKNQARVSVTANFKNQKSCDFEDKLFIVSRKKTTKLKIKCGIKIVAYYENNKQPPNDN